MRSRTAVLKARSAPRLPAICCSEKLMKTAALPIATSARTQKISRTPSDRIGNGLKDALGPAQSTTNRTSRRPAEAGRYRFSALKPDATVSAQKADATISDEGWRSG